MKRLLVLLIVLAGLSATPLAAAGDLILSRSVLEDVSGNLPFAEAAGRPFHPIPQTFSKGYSSSAFWLRLRVRRPAQGDRVVLFINQPFLNEVRLFQADPASPSGWTSRVTGNLHPYRQRDRPEPSLGFNVPMAAPEATFYLRLKTESPAQLTVVALEPAEADQLDHRIDLLELFFVTSMLMLLAWAVFSYCQDRVPAVRLFALHQAVYILYGVAITGYLAPVLPAGSILARWSTTLPYCAVAFTPLLFCRELFRPYQPPRLLMRGLDLLLLVFPLELAAMAMGHLAFAGMLNFVLVKCTWYYFVVIVFAMRREQMPSRRTLRVMFVAITLVFTCYWLFAGRTANPTNLMAGKETLVINGLLIGGLFAAILNARTRRLVLEAQRSQLELQAKSEFLALVSHEIRTPLGALVGFSSLARKATDPDRIRQYNLILEESARVLLDLVNNILDLSKIEAGRMELETVPFSLSQLVRSLADQFRPLAEQKGLGFQTRFGPEDWVLGDPTRLRQILTNLLANAVKFTEAGEVAFTVSRTQAGPASAIRFEVRDTGIGLGDASRDRLFQPFHQMDPSITRRYGGTGLGLAIVQHLVRQMRGTVSVRSRLGAGSCFAVELPLPEAEPVAEAVAPPETAALGAALVVEDNAFNRRLLGDILTDLGGRVTLAANGSEALECLERQPYDVILLDIRMPGMDGMELARRVRKLEAEGSRPRVPILAITADADAATRKSCLAAGVNAVLAKPVSPEALVRELAIHCPAAAATELLDRHTLDDLAGDPVRTQQYRELLLQDIGEELGKLQAALEADSRLDLGRTAHTLKGLCGHLASRTPGELALWLQQNAASAPPERMRPVVDQLRLLALPTTAPTTMESKP